MNWLKPFPQIHAKTQLFLFSLAKDTWPVSHHKLPDRQLSLLNCAALCTHLSRKAHFVQEPPFTPTLWTLHLSSLFPEYYVLPASRLTGIAVLDFNGSRFACVMERCFTDFFWPQVTVGIKFMLWPGIHTHIHNHTHSIEAFTIQNCISFLDQLPPCTKNCVIEIYCVTALEIRSLKPRLAWAVFSLVTLGDSALPPPSLLVICGLHMHQLGCMAVFPPVTFHHISSVLICLCVSILFFFFLEGHQSY